MWLSSSGSLPVSSHLEGLFRGSELGALCSCLYRVLLCKPAMIGYFRGGLLLPVILRTNQNVLIVLKVPMETIMSKKLDLLGT